jgi:hypothetical protein
MVTAVRMHEPRITVGEEPEKCVLRPARLANAVRWLPAREDVAATDAGPVSGAALEAERMEGARVHGDYLLWSVDQFSPSGCAPDYGPHGHRLEGARLVPTLLHMGALQSGGPDFKVLWEQLSHGLREEPEETRLANASYHADFSLRGRGRTAP